MANGWYRCKDGFRIPAGNNPLRIKWDADYRQRVEDYFGTPGRKFVPVSIPLDRISGGHTVMPGHPRTDFYTKLYKLGEPVPPIVVSEMGTGWYNVLDGNRRIGSASAAGKTHVPGLLIVDEKQKKPGKKSPTVYTATKARKLGKSIPEDAVAQVDDSFIVDLSKNEREVPEKLPPRIARALWAIRQPGVLTNELRDTKYRQDPNPFAGQCFVASNALYHLIGGERAGWQMVCIHREHMKDLAEDTHWFLRHKKTGHIIDATADQFEGDNIPYEKGVAKGTSQTGGDVGKPTKRAQKVINRVTDLLDDRPREYLGTLEHDGKEWYIRPPEGKLGKAIVEFEVEVPDEPLAKMALVHDDPAKPATVFRVQNEQGQGPYRSGDEGEYSAVSEHIPSYKPERRYTHQHLRGDNPTPHEDFTGSDLRGAGLVHGHGDPVLFGFPSPEAALRWFGDKGLRTLADYGFHLTEVPAAKMWVSESGSQAIFHPADSSEGGKPFDWRTYLARRAEQQDKWPALVPPEVRRRRERLRALVPASQTGFNFPSGEEGANPHNLKKAESKPTRISIDDAHKLYDWFHLSYEEPDANGTFNARPYIPKNAMSGEDMKTKRICVGPSIHHCIAGIVGKGLYEGVDPGQYDYEDVPTPDQLVSQDPSLINQFRGMHVYGVPKRARVILPSEGQVPDAPQTGEGWLLKPTKLQHVGQLQADQRGNTIPSFGEPYLAKAEPRSIAPGHLRFQSPDGKQSEWDYSHLLTEDARKEGYRLRLRTNSAHTPTMWAQMGPDYATNHIQNKFDVLVTKTVDGRTRPAGQLTGSWKDKTIEPWESLVQEQDRRKRLGQAMYEAVYAHGRAHLGATQVSGDYHSTSAHLVHKKLSAKYGLNYEAKPNVGRQKAYTDMTEWRETPPHDSDAKYGKYKYRLPKVDEPKPVNMFAEHRLPGALDAEGYKMNVAHTPEGSIGTIHRHGRVLGHIEMNSSGHPFEEWTGEGQREGLRDAAMMVLRGHGEGKAYQDGWNHPVRGDAPLTKAMGEGHVGNPPSVEEGPAQGSHITAAHPTYAAAAAAKPKGQEYEGGKNLWARNNTGKSNSGRTLMVQFSTDLLQGGRQRDAADDYYDKLYSKREGYHRGEDWWEVPQWQAHLAHSMPDADHYTVRDPEEAIRFINAAGYKHVAFSALDVNKDFVKRLAAGAPEQHVVVGGYTDMSHFNGLPNVSVHPTIESFVKSEGRDYRPGYDYRHFTGTKVIPRLTLSDGCRHQCTFCCVPKKVDEKTREEILQQADSFAEHLPSDLIYLNDKTFGQASNHAMLPELYQRIKAKNPAFKGFVIQTTAAQMKRFTPEFLRQAGIKHIELGIESVNDDILRAHKKPANEGLIEEAANKVRAAGASLIPNIMVGLPGENRDTYGRTMAWLQRHQDIISHVNTYNLALYDDSELGKKLQAISAGDRDENVQTKSWHTDPAAHREFADALLRFASGQLDRPIGHTPLVKTTMEHRIASLRERKSEPNVCPKCGYRVRGSFPVRVIGEPVFECPECEHHWEVPFPKDLENSDIGTTLPDGRVVDKTMVKAEVDPHPPVVATIMVQDGLGRTLWGKRRKDGKYTLPGGHADMGEPPAQAALRELYEEAGLVPETMWYLGAGNGPDGPVHLYHAIAHGQPTAANDPDREMASWEWHDCLRGPPPHITANLAHRPNVVYSLMGWLGGE